MATKEEPTTTTPLWGGKKLPVLGVTGEFGSGKSLFILTIDPDCFAVGEPRTIVWGTEDGLTSYEDTFAFEHRPLTKIMLKPGYRPEMLYLEWLAQMRAIKPGKYRVGGLDTVSEIESGLVDWVRHNPGHFNRTKAQYARMEGLMWGDVKSLWKQHLSEASARFETFAFSSHTKIVWKGDRPTTERTAKGKETLWELASLYLWLDRTPRAKAKTAPAQPSGKIFQGKNRLVWMNPKTGELEPILPPRLPIATPAAIRAYIQKPTDYANLKLAERLDAPIEMSADERLLIESSIASDNAMGAAAELTKVELMQKAAAAQGQNMKKTITASSDHKVSQKDQVLAGPHTSGISSKLRGEIVDLFEALGISHKDAREILARRGVAKLSDLSPQAGEELIDKLQTQADIPF